MSHYWDKFNSWKYLTTIFDENTFFRKIPISDEKQFFRRKNTSWDFWIPTNTSDFFLLLKHLPYCWSRPLSKLQNENEYELENTLLNQQKQKIEKNLTDVGAESSTFFSEFNKILNTNQSWKFRKKNFFFWKKSVFRGIIFLKSNISFFLENVSLRKKYNFD